MTLDQYELLPEDQRVEVFDGNIYDMSAPSVVHQRIIISMREYSQQTNWSVGCFSLLTK